MDDKPARSGRGQPVTWQELETLRHNWEDLASRVAEIEASARENEATPLALDNAQYRAAYKVDNPNLPLIAELKRAGVDFAVCGQAVAEHGFQYEWIDKGVTLALSALTTITDLEHDGYVLMPL